MAPPRARQQPRGQRRCHHRRVLRGLRRVPRRRPGLRPVHGRHQGHRRAGRAARAGHRRRRFLLPRTLHEPQRVVVGGGGRPGRAGGGRDGGAGGEQGQGAGGAADAVPGETQEPAVRQDDPVRVPQGIRRDAAAHQGPLRQARLRGGRGRGAGARESGVLLAGGVGACRVGRRRPVLLLSAEERTGGLGCPPRRRRLC